MYIEIEKKKVNKEEKGFASKCCEKMVCRERMLVSVLLGC